MEVPRTNLDIQDEYSKLVPFLSPEVKAALETRDFKRTVESSSTKLVPKTGYDVSFDIIKWAGIKVKKLDAKAFKKFSRTLQKINQEFGGIKGALAKAISLDLKNGQFILLSYFALSEKEAKRYDLQLKKFVPEEAKLL